MIGLSSYCEKNFTARQLVWLQLLSNIIPVREYKRIHSPSTVSQVDQFLIMLFPMVDAVAKGGDDDLTDEQNKIWDALKADGSGEFQRNLKEALASEGAPPSPGIDNVRCAVDLAQYACFCSSLAQTGSKQNIENALAIAKQQGRWLYACTESVLQDPLHTNWMDVVKDDTSTGTTPGTGSDPGGGAGGGTTPVVAKEDDVKSHKNLYIGLGIGAAVLATGAATWLLWPKKGASQTEKGR